jgi:hypothetical protein
VDPKPTTPRPRQAGQIVADPEVKALATIGRLLAELEPDARLRVLAYMNDKYAARAEKGGDQP